MTLHASHIPLVLFTSCFGVLSNLFICRTFWQGGCSPQERKKRYQKQRTDRERRERRTEGTGTFECVCVCVLLIAALLLCVSLLFLLYTTTVSGLPQWWPHPFVGGVFPSSPVRGRMQTHLAHTYAHKRWCLMESLPLSFSLSLCVCMLACVCCSMEEGREPSGSAPNGVHVMPSPTGRRIVAHEASLSAAKKTMSKATLDKLERVSEPIPPPLPPKSYCVPICMLCCWLCGVCWRACGCVCPSCGVWGVCKGGGCWMLCCAPPLACMGTQTHTHSLSHTNTHAHMHMYMDKHTQTHADLHTQTGT